MKDRILNRPQTARHTRIMVKDRRPTSATPPRPKSVQGLPGGLASRCVSPAAERPRPKSGKSLTFHLNNGTDGRDSPTLSCSTRGFGPLNSRMASTPKINGLFIDDKRGDYLDNKHNKTLYIVTSGSRGREGTPAKKSTAMTKQ